MPKQCKDMTGLVFFRLKVISKAFVKKKNCHWNCLCECGKYTIVSRQSLIKNSTKSCGCFLRKHNGLSHTTCFRTWESMIDRCYNTRHKSYSGYGGKGITVCDRWKNSFLLFLEDMGDRPAGMTLDRIDNSGNYDKSNCRWTTMKIQSNNKSNNRFIKAFGREQTLAQWSDETKINKCTLSYRLKSGLSAEEALTFKKYYIGTYNTHVL